MEPEFLAAISAAEAQIAARDLEPAASALRDVQGRLAPILAELGGAAVAGTAGRLGAALDEHSRVEAVARGLVAAQAVVADADKCATPESVAGAWKDLSRTAKSDPERKEADVLAKKLEKCRLGIQRNLVTVASTLMTGQRASMPAKMETVFLDAGMDVRISLRGKAKDEIRFTWVLMSRVTIHQLTDGGSMAAGAFLRNLQDTGFRKVVFADGYSESTTYTLDPQDLGEAAAESLAKDGLGTPLVLPS